MKLVHTQRSEYAARALGYLAQCHDLASAEEIAAATEVPKAALHQVLQALGRAQLVSSRAGVGGGYALTRPPADCTLRMVLEAVEGPLNPNVCGLTGLACSSMPTRCALHELYTEALSALSRAAEARTVADLARADRTQRAPAGRTHRS